MSQKMSDLEKLIKLVDDPVQGWKKLSFPRKLLPKMPDFIFLGLSTFFLIILYYAVAYLLPAVNEPGVLLAIVVALTSLVLNMGVVVKQLTKSAEKEEMIQTTVDWNFDRLKKLEKTKDQWPLLKALLRLKAVEGDFELSVVYGKYPSLFVEENLIANLYGLSPSTMEQSRDGKSKVMASRNMTEGRRKKDRES